MTQNSAQSFRLLVIVPPPPLPLPSPSPLTVLYKISIDCFFVVAFSNTGFELIRYVLLP